MLEKIRSWVYAKEMPGEKNDFSDEGEPGGDDTKFPFYPERMEDWKNKQVKNVFPPYPYIILSCS